MMKKEFLNALAAEIVDACIDVHREMGPGLLESIYEYCLIKELHDRGIKAESQTSLPLHYKGEILPKDFRADIMVEDEVILELKTVDRILPVHEAQIISYMKLADKRLGFLLNFNVDLMKHGIRRFVNGF